MKHLRLLVCILGVVSLIACTDTGFTGNSGGEKEKPEVAGTERVDKTKDARPRPRPKTQGNPKSSTDPNVASPPNHEPSWDDEQDIDWGSLFPDPPKEPDVPANDPGADDKPTAPDAVVDGQEVVLTCSKCLARAKELAKGLGFVADMSKTHNLGFYKIPPEKGLCDVHFMADMSVPIDDHEGKDSIGNQQVILYCPCNCNWANNPGDYFPPPPGFGDLGPYY